MHSLRCLALLTAVVLTSSASAAELVMFRRDGCPWCKAWDRDIGAIYGKTEIGRRLPLRLVNLDRHHPDVALNIPVRFTPTFVLVEGGREVGRIEGYPGEDFFWGLLERIIQRLLLPAASDLSAAPLATQQYEIPHAPTSPS